MNEKEHCQACPHFARKDKYWITADDGLLEEHRHFLQNKGFI